MESFGHHSNILVRWLPRRTFR